MDKPEWQLVGDQDLEVEITSELTADDVKPTPKTTAVLVECVKNSGTSVGTEFICANVWQRITAAVKKKPGKCAIAVAYFGRGAARRLPLKKGSTLIVNMSDSAIKAGITDPKELLKPIRKGVAVHTVANLHAKVFVIGDQAFVGSNNASDHSANRLIEACVRTDSPQVVKSARDEVFTLKGELITPEFAKAKSKLYRPPRFIGGTSQRQLKRSATRAAVKPLHAPLWVIPLVPTTLDEQERAESEKAVAVAKKRIRSNRLYKVEDFLWHGRELIERLKRDHLVIQQVEVAPGKRLLYPAERLIHQRAYRRGRERHAVYCYPMQKKGFLTRALLPRLVVSGDVGACWPTSFGTQIRSVRSDEKTQSRLRRSRKRLPQRPLGSVTIQPRNAPPAGHGGGAVE